MCSAKGEGVPDCEKHESTPCKDWGINKKSEKRFVGVHIEKPVNRNKSDNNKFISYDSVKFAGVHCNIDFQSTIDTEKKYALLQ